MYLQLPLVSEAVVGHRLSLLSMQNTLSYQQEEVKAAFNQLPIHNQKKTCIYLIFQLEKVE